MVNGKSDYIVTGSFSGKAAKRSGQVWDVHIAYNGKDNDFTEIPTQDQVRYS